MKEVYSRNDSFGAPGGRHFIPDSSTGCNGKNLHAVFTKSGSCSDSDDAYLATQPDNGGRNKIISIGLILFFIALGAFARHQDVKVFFTKAVRPALLVNGTTSVVYPIDPVDFVYYILGGLITGCLLSFVLVKKRKNRIP